MKKRKFFILMLAVSITLFCCKKKGSNPIPTLVPIPAPTKTTLLLPAQNEVCTTGENQTSTQTTVRFDWADAANADSYVLSLKNLLTGIVTDYPSTQSEIKIPVTRGTPFSWFITSKSSKTTAVATSDTWRFYSSGEGQTAYAPFPAALTYPAAGQVINYTTSTITLTWTGSDTDNDIATYDIYYGKNSTPTLLATNKADNASLAVAITANTVFYWRILTKDVKGNTSDSGVNQFKIN